MSEAAAMEAQVVGGPQALLTQGPWLDFREYDPTYGMQAHEIAQRDGFPDNDR